MKARTIAQTFANLRKRGRRALIPYVMGGDPDLATTAEIVRALAAAGADLIELGLPFSDPLADGPAIQAAGQRALKHKITCKDLFDLVRSLREDLSLPILIMTYYNPVFVKGVAAFTREAARAGVSGLIVPDLPIEESAELEAACKRNGLNLIFLAAPTSPPERLKALAARTRGFLYYVSRTGVTGARKSLPADLTRKLKMLRKVTRVPIGVGFGIKDAAQARKVGKLADGVIIGSAIVRIIEERGTSTDLGERLTDFVKPIAEALHSG